MGFEFLPNLLSTLPGTVVYHLLVFLGLLVAGGIVLTEWRHTRSPDLKPYLLAISGTMGVHLLSVVLTPLHQQSGGIISIVSAPLLYAGELVSVLLLVWAFGWRLWGQRARTILETIVAGWGLLLLAAAVLWYLEAATKPVMYTVHSWQVPVWYLLLAISAFVGLVVMLRIGQSGVVPIAFGLIGVGSLLGMLGSQALNSPILIGEGLARLCYLVAYPLFAISLYNSALQDLDSYRQELQDLSQEALRQSQELLFLVEATRSIGETLDLSGMLGRVADSVAMALRADTVAILLTDEEDPHNLDMVALYQVLGRKGRVPQDVKLNNFPVLSFALRKRQLVFGPHDDFKQLMPLFKVIGVEGKGPLLIQPLTRQERTMGVLLACNDSSQSPFTQEQERLATTIAVQIAGAVENSRLYGALEAKAQELSWLLKVREAELRREDAILESMAEGILVSDAKGQFILLNRAAEEILDASRTEILGRSVADLLSQPALSSELNATTIMNLSNPLETTLDLNERKLRMHAAPVLMEDGERLGVVAILQDITREYLAEEAKREFIASISHELRTPLTAIKGYTEMMLSGMAGEAPPAYGQFLGVIRENTVRMNSLTDNIISVAEIERGRVGLNYQTLEVPQIIQEILGRYRERINERQLTLELDLPPDLPAIEVDSNRLRLILDNILNNAIKFTYPNGKITIGCRGIQGTLGEPTFFSIWISDTGVGIPLEEQLLIWERFYRVEDSPLSLEAGGLGIGLTITKALVEAHGGRVWVDSTIDEGSTFTVLLPTKRTQSLEEELEARS